MITPRESWQAPSVRLLSTLSDSEGVTKVPQPTEGTPASAPSGPV